MTSSTTAERSPTKVARVVWSPVERPLESDGPQIDLRTARVLVLGAASPQRAGIVNNLRAVGATTHFGYPGLGPQSTPESWLVDGRPPTIVVDLGLAPPFSLEDRTTWRLPLLRSIGALRACYESWSEEFDATSIFYLAVTYLGGTMGYGTAITTSDMVQPLGGLWAGLAKTLHREIPNCNARVIDISAEEIDALPQIIVDEIGRPGTVEVGYANGRRWSLTGRRAPVGPDIGGLTEKSRVVVSGGGRGIGYRLACHIADTAGTRVIVTGRSALADTRPWESMSEAELANIEKRGWEQRGKRSVREVRTERDRNRGLWELATNLRSARDKGFDIEYRQCNFTRRGQVRTLLAEFSDLTGVIHNAGVDSPSRLPGKSDDDILRTVSTKIDGLTNLLAAIEEQNVELDFLCIVGSLTGRLGGMVGQFDYAAANDGLARLGMWANARAPYPVSTMAWPTWDNVGLIANFAASLRYMTPLDVNEGLEHWGRELRARTTGEVTFVGHLGRAIDPGQAIGYEFPADLADHAATAGRLFHLGRVQRYRPGRQLISWIDTSDGADATFGDLLVDGRPAVTPTAMIERILGAVDWIIDPGLDEPALRRIDNVSVDYAQLQDGGRYCRTMHLTPLGDYVAIDACVRRVLDGPPAVTMRAYFQVADAPGPIECPEIGEHPGVAASGPPVTVRWQQRTLTIGRERDGHAVCGVEISAQDRWSVPSPTTPALSVSAIETLLALTAGQHANVVRTAHIGRIDVLGPRPERWTARQTGDRWTVTDAETDFVVQTMSAGPVSIGSISDTVPISANPGT